MASDLSSPLVRPSVITAMVEHMLGEMGINLFSGMCLTAYSRSCPTILSDRSYEYYLGGHWLLELRADNDADVVEKLVWFVHFGRHDLSACGLFSDGFVEGLPGHVFLQSSGEAWAVILEMHHRMKPLSAVQLSYGNPWVSLP